MTATTRPTAARGARLRRDGLTILWPCASCHEPVEDGEGFVTVDSETAMQRHEAHVEADYASRRGAELSGNRLRVFTVEDIRNASHPPVPWVALHSGPACDPHDVTNYLGWYWIGVERIRTLRQLLSWTAHLLEKEWIGRTDWDQLLRSLGQDA